MNLYLFQKINGLVGQYFLLDNVAIFFAKYLGYGLAVLLVVLFYKNYKIIFQAFLAAVIARFFFVELIRWFWPINRPFVENNVLLLIEHAANGSFPSGHAAFFFALSTVIYFYNRKIGALFLGASFLIALARIFVGVHWPADILAGASIGILSACLILIFSKSLKK